LRQNESSNTSLTWATGPKGIRIPDASPPDDSMEPAKTIPAATSLSPLSSQPAAIYAKSARKTTDDVVAFGTGLGADALHGTLESTAIFEIVRDNL